MPAGVVVTIDSSPQGLFSLLTIYGSHGCPRFHDKTLDYGLVDKTLYSRRDYNHTTLLVCVCKKSQLFGSVRLGSRHDRLGQTDTAF